MVEDSFASALPWSDRNRSATTGESNSPVKVEEPSRVTEETSRTRVPLSCNGIKIRRKEEVRKVPRPNALLPVQEQTMKEPIEQKSKETPGESLTCNEASLRRRFVQKGRLPEHPRKPGETRCDRNRIESRIAPRIASGTRFPSRPAFS